MSPPSILPFLLICCFSVSTFSHGQNKSLATSRDVISAKTISAPLYQEPVRDEVFGNEVTKIVGDSGTSVEGMEILWSRPARHIYSMVSAWDCSDELLAIRNSGASKADGSGAWEWLLLNGQSFEPVVPLQTSFVEFRWWNTQAKRMLVVGAEGLVDYDPIANESVPILGADSVFSRYENVNLGSQGNLADDDSMIVLLGTLPESGVRHAIVYSFKEGVVKVEIPLPFPRVDYATISPLGKHVIVVGEFVKDEADRTRVLDLAGNQVGEDWGPYGTPSHYDLAVSEDGHEIAVGVAKTALPKIKAGSIISREVESGKIQLLLSGGYAMHISCRNLGLPGWAFVTYPEIDTAMYPPFSNELVAVRTDGSGEFRRLCQLHHVEGDYWAQPQACPSSKGAYAVFATNWQEVKRAAECAVVETGLAGE